MNNSKYNPDLKSIYLKTGSILKNAAFRIYANRKKILKITCLAVLGSFILVILLFTAISFGWFGELPTFEDLENPKGNQATEIYSADGKIIGTFYIENRNIIKYDDLPPYLINALIAREDHRFYKHSGIDYLGLMRVLGKTVLLFDKSEGGGSTITQQLAKQLFPRDIDEQDWWFTKKKDILFAKVKEWIIAKRLEEKYSKKQILTMYFNTVPFGSEAYGIKTGSLIYFGKLPNDLKIEEAALMVGMLKGTSMYNPQRNPQRALIRRNSVLRRMQELSFINKAQFDSLVKTPLKLHYQPMNHKSGIATYLREYIRYSMNRNKPDPDDYNDIYSYREDSTRWEEDPLFGWCNKNLKPDGKKYNLYKDGLKIYTTIDSRMQQYAEEALKEHLSNTVQPAFFKAKKGNKKAPFANNLSNSEIKERLKIAMEHSERYKNLLAAGYSKREIEKNFRAKTDMQVFSWQGVRDTVMSPLDSIRYHKFFLRGSFLSIDPHNGYIKAYVGGPNIKFFNFDGVMLQKRQIGSTIKPFLYTVAINAGMSPFDSVINVSDTFELSRTRSYIPHNDDTLCAGQKVSLIWGLSHSVNAIAAHLLKQYGYDSLIHIMREAGIISELPEVPSLSLGVAELSVNELVGAYAIFANKGIYNRPICVTRIEDKQGRVLTTITSKSTKVINEETAYIMLQMLQDVVKNGTGMRLQTMLNNSYEIGGKTGTTQNHSDGWFVGVTPDLVSGAWVGGDEPSIHFDRMSEGQGAVMTLPIFGLYMKKVYADSRLRINQVTFEKPDSFDVRFDDRFRRNNGPY
jgi:penicillin-binding protein 1A